MLLQDVVRVLAARWYVFVPTVLLSAALAVLTFRAVAPTYTAHTSLLMLPPEAAAAGAGDDATNPIRAFDGGLVAVGTVVSIVLMNTTAADELRSQGVEEYEVAVDPSSVAPLVNITVTSRDASVTMESMRSLVTMFSDELVARQEAVEAPSATWVRASTLSQSPRPEKTLGEPVRAALGVTALGMLGAFGLTFAVEGAAARRRRSSASVAHIDVISHAAPGAQRRPGVDRSVSRELPRRAQSR